MAYIGNELNTVFTVGKLYSIHYFEYMSTFAFEGESHDFWEFVYVDKGEVNITAGTRKGKLYFTNRTNFTMLRQPVILPLIWSLSHLNAPVKPCSFSGAGF